MHGVPPAGCAICFAVDYDPSQGNGATLEVDPDTINPVDDPGRCQPA